MENGNSKLGKISPEGGAAAEWRGKSQNPERLNLRLNTQQIGVSGVTWTGDGGHRNWAVGVRNCCGGRNELSILRSVEKTERISGIAPQVKREEGLYVRT